MPAVVTSSDCRPRDGRRVQPQPAIVRAMRAAITDGPPYRFSVRASGQGFDRRRFVSWLAVPISRYVSISPWTIVRYRQARFRGAAMSATHMRPSAELSELWTC